MPYWGQWGLQDSASWINTLLINFHDHAMMILVMILTFVSYALLSLALNKQSCTNIVEAQKVETIWTIVPAIILFSLAFPSLRLLYLMDEVMTPHLTVKAIGNQWYWTYEYADFNQLSFDSYMTPTSNLDPQHPFRLLEVDNRLLLPANINIRILVTSTDVMHSWAVPSFGVKADAIPGRLNQLGIFIMSPGIYYGQCSEICGANHSFMPIAVEVRSPNDFCSIIMNATS
uniref:Cytochrome c oxidase subunit 2 n=1 Tax=Phascolopsis gouldii TaxID=6442 RepID=Q952F3_PHAGO|nr:cytochrome oxidase subunit II [Phascolopsis gouldii]